MRSRTNLQSLIRRQFQINLYLLHIQINRIKIGWAISKMHNYFRCSCIIVTVFLQVNNPNYGASIKK